jgi:hypothetical protein
MPYCSTMKLLLLVIHWFSYLPILHHYYSGVALITIDFGADEIMLPMGATVPETSWHNFAFSLAHPS